MAVLRARLSRTSGREQRAADSAARRSMIGAGDRADKIRTYNYPQDRVTDHRIGMDLSNLPRVLGGDLDGLIDALITTDQAERLAISSRTARPAGAGPPSATPMATVDELLRVGVDRLRASGSESPRLDAELLLGRRRTRPDADHRLPRGVRRGGGRGILAADLDRRERASRSPTSAASRSSTASPSRSTRGRSSRVPRPSALVELAEAEIVDPPAGRTPPTRDPPIRVADIGTGSRDDRDRAVRRRCAAGGCSTRSRSWRRTSPLTPSSSPARTPSPTPSPTGSSSSIADLLPPGGELDRRPRREPPVHPDR